jgi:hypothetical protein
MKKKFNRDYLFLVDIFGSTGVNENIWKNKHVSILGSLLVQCWLLLLLTIHFVLG